MFFKKVEPKKAKSNGYVTRATSTHEGAGIKTETGQPKASDHIQRISLSNMHHLLISSYKSSSNNFTSSLCYMFFFVVLILVTDVCNFPSSTPACNVLMLMFAYYVDLIWNYSNQNNQEI